MNKAHKVDKEIKFLIIIIMIGIIFGVLIVKEIYSIEIANRNARVSERLEDITKAGYDECTLYGDDLFVSEGIMRDIMEEPSETNITAEELIRREYGDCAFFDDKTFISDGKLYRYKYDKDGQLHVFYEEDVTDKVITGRGKEKQDE